MLESKISVPNSPCALVGAVCINDGYCRIITIGNKARKFFEELHKACPHWVIEAEGSPRRYLQVLNVWSRNDSCAVEDAARTWQLSYRMAGKTDF